MRGGKGWRGLHPVPSHLPFLGKGLRTLVLTGHSLGPGSSLMIPLVPGPPCPVLASCRCPSRCNRQGPIHKSPSESDKSFRSARKINFGGLGKCLDDVLEVFDRGRNCHQANVCGRFGNGLNTSNIFPVCQAQCDGIIIAQAYNPELDNPINRDFVAAYTAENKKAPPQFTAQAFTGIQVFVEALKRVDDKNKLSTLSLEQIRQQLNQEILAGKYVTVLGDIAFTPEGEIIQDKFSVAQIKMDADGKNGKFTFVKN